MPAAIWLGQTAVERTLLVGSVLIVMIVELLNTGIEVVVDRISHERHHLSGFAKDLGSSAVLLIAAAGGNDLDVRAVGPGSTLIRRSSSGQATGACASNRWPVTPWLAEPSR